MKCIYIIYIAGACPTRFTWPHSVHQRLRVHVIVVSDYVAIVLHRHIFPFCSVLSVFEVAALSNNSSLSPSIATMSTSPSSLLLKGGVVLLHGADDHVEGVKRDILVDNGKIIEISEDIKVSAGVKVIDCSDKIISPGFVDTRKGYIFQCSIMNYSYSVHVITYIVFCFANSTAATR